MGTRCADHVTPLYPQKLALTSLTGGSRSVGIVHVRTKATEFFSFQKCFICFLSLFVSIQVSDAYVKVLSIIMFFSLNCNTGVCYLILNVYIFLPFTW